MRILESHRYWKIFALKNVFLLSLKLSTKMLHFFVMLIQVYVFQISTVCQYYLLVSADEMAHNFYIDVSLITIVRTHSFLQ